MAADNHKKHKERLRERFLEAQDFNGFAEHEMLELMLNYIIVRKNTNDIAHRLISAFGSLDAVLRATPEELIKVDGINMRTAVFLVMQYSLLRYYNHSVVLSKKETGDIYKDALDRLIPLFKKLEEEKMYLVTITSSHKIRNIHCIADGSASTVMVTPRMIVSECVKDNAFAVILAHNHPGGIMKPSQEDITFTQYVNKALTMVDIKLAEHYIIAEDSVYPIIKNTSIDYMDFLK